MTHYGFWVGEKVPGCHKNGPVEVSRRNDIQSCSCKLTILIYEPVQR